MIKTSGRLIVVENNGMCIITLTGAVYSHVTIGTGAATIVNNLKRCFVSVNDM
jgi:hypothetical protein